MSVSLSLKNICRRYIKDNEEFMAVNNVNLDVNPGEFLTFLGPSGCGKTTTLRMIAGFETPTSGQILVDGVDITNVPANERGLGFVFQNYALFPHMTIFDNVSYGLKIRGESGEAMAKKVREALALVGLTKAEQRYPNQFSGGGLSRASSFSVRSSFSWTNRSRTSTRSFACRRAFRSRSSISASRRRASTSRTTRSKP